MFMYKDETGNKVIFVRKKCRCSSKRDHIFTVRVQKFCFHWDEVSWHKGLCFIALMTIFFGIVEFLLFNVVAFRGAPAAIPSYFMFPLFSGLAFVELILFFSLGIMLWLGVYNGNLKLIKSFPWILLLGYILAAMYIFIIFVDGELIVRSLVWSDFGMPIKSETEKEKKALLIQRIILYTSVTILILALILFTTYIIILTLSWIDKLETEIDDEVV